MRNITVYRLVIFALLVLFFAIIGIVVFAIHKWKDNLDAPGFDPMPIPKVEMSI